VIEWQFLSADDEVLASEMDEFRYAMCLLSFVYVKIIVYEGQK